MLNVTDLTASYGPVPVIRGVTFSIAKGEVVALIGRNGVGKTTLLRSLMAMLPVRQGQIELDGEAVDTLRTHQIARRGMMLVPQGRGILSRLTVGENIAAGMRAAGDRQPLPLAEALAPFPALRERINNPGGALSGGQQQQLALARAMVSRPSMLLLDEPSEGVQPNIVHEIGELIGRLASETGVSVLLVEQNIELALQAAHRCLVMEKGQIVHQGPVDELRDDAVLKRYLAL
ncbi:ABC transporter ATP-binding protein [Microbaculum sp. FT89]|uniref:ABC transporter ATP-binding protein n=1 Tax=Microbaculum sp. FT89 TaxID=3447298 RepID=UPI003F52F1CB